MPVNCLAIRS
uniref:Uncharacterized protein n=1 Tax=Arundo donax TaxID=35708 RepID=A0A0A9EX37_ARUDO